MLGTEAVWDSLRALPSAFGSSLGGNPLCCRVGLAAIEIATEESFGRTVAAHTETLGTRLPALVARFPRLLAAHRGIGMMHGLEFHDETLGGMVLALLLRHGVTSTYSLYHNRVLRVQPPMVISPADLAYGLDVLERVLAEVDARQDDPTGRPAVPCSPSPGRRWCRCPAPNCATCCTGSPICWTRSRWTRPGGPRPTTG